MDSPYSQDKAANVFSLPDKGSEFVYRLDDVATNGVYTVNDYRLRVSPTLPFRTVWFAQYTTLNPTTRSLGDLFYEIVFYRTKQPVFSTGKMAQPTLGAPTNIDSLGAAIGFDVNTSGEVRGHTADSLMYYPWGPGRTNVQLYAMRFWGVYDEIGFNVLSLSGVAANAVTKTVLAVKSMFVS